MSGKRRGPRPYAEGTNVPVVQTKHELEKLLERHGAAQFLAGSDAKAGLGFVGFTLEGRMYRLQLRRREGKGDPAQRDREQWRALLLVVKGKLEIIARGDTTAQHEFLADLVLPDGKTVGAALEPQIAESYSQGGMPKLLGAGPDWQQRR